MLDLKKNFLKRNKKTNEVIGCFRMKFIFSLDSIHLKIFPLQINSIKVPDCDKSYSELLCLLNGMWQWSETGLYYRK